MFSQPLRILRTTPAARMAFSTTPTARKTITEKVSEVADKVSTAYTPPSAYRIADVAVVPPLQVNKKVGKTLAATIETGEGAAKAAKETIGG